jgi:hypothetical protein
VTGVAGTIQEQVHVNPLKDRPNHGIYIHVLRGMTPEQRVEKAFELGETARALFKEGLRRRFPELSTDEFHALYLRRLELCRNRSY